MNARPHYTISIVEALRALGGTGTPSDVYRWIDENRRIRHEDKQKSNFWYRREVRFSRQNLYLAGLIISPKRGVWSLTEIGLEVEINEELPRLVERRMQEALARQRNIPKDVPYTCDFKIENRIPQPTTGPQPTSWSSRITRTIGNESGVYIMKFGKHDLWKIGYTTNLETHLRDINRHIPHEILNKQ